VTTKFTSRRGLLFTGLLTVALVGSACGDDNNNTKATGKSDAKITCGSGTLSGAGATFVQTIVSQWVKDYQTACPGTTVNYQAVGSGAGIQQFKEGTVDFGASDVLMKPEEEAAATAKRGEVLTIPWTSGAIAVEFNLAGVTSLKLTPQTLAGIFAGKITKWDDAQLAADNKGLPSKPIQVVHRSDGSGTTGVFTGYMTASAPLIWTAGAAKDVPWPVGTGAKGSDGVTATVKQTDGAIGYAELSFAKGSALPVASVKNSAGEFIEPTNGAVKAALSGQTVPANLKLNVSFTVSDTKAYPISTVSFVLVPKAPGDPAKAKFLKSFVTYALTTGQKAAPNLFYAELPSSLAQQGVTAVATVG